EVLGVPQEIVHDDVGGIERGELLEEAGDIALGVVIADAAVDDLRLFSGSLQHSFEPRLDRLLLRHAPTERDRAAEEKNAASARWQGINGATAQAPLVDPDVYALENG